MSFFGRRSVDGDAKLAASHEVAVPPETDISPLNLGENSVRREHMRTSVEKSLSRDKAEPSSGIQDRMFNALFQQLLPPEERTLVQRADGGSHHGRPGFSLAVMSANFRRFNARIGVVFVFQKRMQRLFSWRVPTHTLSFLAVYSFLCLNPYLLTVLPLAMALFFIMVPAYLARHPPPPAQNSSDVPEPYSLYGPPTAPARSMRPPPELSRDVLENLAHLQNSMGDFVAAHDAIVHIVGPNTNFADEARCSFVFVSLAATASLLCLSAHLLPWRGVFLTSGWAAIGGAHPRVASALRRLARDPHVRPRVREGERKVAGALARAIARDIALDEPPDRREVEAFELQRREPGENAWEPWLFGPSPWDPRAEARVAGERPPGTRFFEDVAPPPGWVWADPEWSLDLMSREWVDERFITGVEVETEGERWVYDIGYAPGGGGDADADDEDASEATFGLQSVSGGDSIYGAAGVRVRAWDESDGRGPKGMWRRRRWVRMVEREVITGDED